MSDVSGCSWWSGGQINRLSALHPCHLSRCSAICAATRSVIRFSSRLNIVDTSFLRAVSALFREPRDGKIRSGAKKSRMRSADAITAFNRERARDIENRSNPTAASRDEGLHRFFFSSLAEVLELMGVSRSRRHAAY